MFSKPNFQSYGDNSYTPIVKYNGRVNIAEFEDSTARFRMMERVNAKNKSHNYYEALNGTMEWNALAQNYFSSKNIDHLQTKMREEIFKMSGGKFIIPLQNIDVVKMVMRNVFTDYAEQYTQQVEQQTQFLNQHVLKILVPRIYTEALAYEKYIEAQSTLITPFDLPKNVDRDWKDLEYNRW
jgi:hypothetical protein